MKKGDWIAAGIFLIALLFAALIIWWGVSGDADHYKRVHKEVEIVCGEPPSRLIPQDGGWWYIVNCPDGTAKIVR
jgi:hypothetical protein